MPSASEAQRRQVPFERRFDEIASVDLVELRAGKRVVLAIPFPRPAIDPVVAEAAKEEVGKRIVARPGEMPAALRSQIDECAQRQRMPDVERAVGPCSTTRPPPACHRRLTDHCTPLLVVHPTERRADVLPLSVALEGEQAIDVDVDVLVLRQAIEIAGEQSRRYRDRCAAVRRRPACGDDPSADRVALAAGLGRTEQIVEVGVVVRRARAPVVALVVGAQVQPLFRRQRRRRDCRRRRDSACSTAADRRSWRAAPTAAASL